MRAAKLVETIRKAGGVLTLDGDGIDCQIPPEATHLVPLLREHKPEIVAILKAQGGRVANFPHCPKCCSYALYRTEQGEYECQTCGLAPIEESTARRVM